MTSHAPTHWAMDSRHLRVFLPTYLGLAQGASIGLQPLTPPANDPCCDDIYQVVNGVAQFELCGTMLPEVPDFCSLSGGEFCSTNDLTEGIDKAAADPAVMSIALSIDSPGGAITGVEALAATIANCQKPIHAVITGLCCSAAYWVASQCDTLTANARSCEIGSIGTYCVAMDSSALYQASGLNMHLISSGGIKGQGVEGVAISPDYLAAEQTIVDQLTALFVAGISAGRGYDLSAFATGQTWLTDEAALLGLIDGLATTPHLSLVTAPAVAPTAARAATAKETGMDLPTLTKLTAEHPAHAVQIVAFAAAGKSEATIRSDLTDLARRAEVDTLNRHLSESKAHAEQLALELANLKAAHATELAAAKAAAATAGKVATLAATAASDPGAGDAPISGPTASIADFQALSPIKQAEFFAAHGQILS